jgi:hypothetical protein
MRKISGRTLNAFEESETEIKIKESMKTEGKREIEREMGLVRQSDGGGTGSSIRRMKRLTCYVLAQAKGGRKECRRTSAEGHLLAFAAHAYTCITKAVLACTFCIL